MLLIAWVPAILGILMHRTQQEKWKPRSRRWAEMLVLKKLPSGNLDKSTLVCKLCKKEFAHHGALPACATTSLPNTLQLASTDNGPSWSRQPRQATLDKMTGFTAKTPTDKLTNAQARWSAADHRPTLGGRKSGAWIQVCALWTI